MANLEYLRAELLLATPLAKAKLLEKFGTSYSDEYLDLLLDKVIKTNLVQGKFTQIETFALANNLFDSVVVLISDEDAPPAR